MWLFHIILGESVYTFPPGVDMSPPVVRSRLHLAHLCRIMWKLSWAKMSRMSRVRHREGIWRVLGETTIEMLGKVRLAPHLAHI